jgi:hypothetical protein
MRDLSCLAEPLRALLRHTKLHLSCPSMPGPGRPGLDRQLLRSQTIPRGTTGCLTIPAMPYPDLPSVPAEAPFSPQRDTPFAANPCQAIPRPAIPGLAITRIAFPAKPRSTPRSHTKLILPRRATTRATKSALSCLDPPRETTRSRYCHTLTCRTVPRAPNHAGPILPRLALTRATQTVLSCPDPP